MKKIIAILISLLFSFSLCTTAFAEEAPFKNSKQLYKAWHEYPPDYVCGIWSRDGSDSFVFGVKDEAGKQKILDLVEDDGSVSFVYQKYSYNYLKRIRDNLWRYLGHIEGELLVGYGIDVMENCLRLDLYDHKIMPPGAIEALEKLRSEYGDAVQFCWRNPEFKITTAILQEGASDSSLTKTPPTMVMLGVVILALACLCVALKMSSSVRLVTNTNKTVTASSSLTAKEVECMVKESNPSLPADLDEKVLNEIEWSRVLH